MQPKEPNSPTEGQVLKKIENYVFDLREKIGEGSFSRVYRGTNIHNNGTVAVKKVRVGDVSSKIARRLLEWEVNILRQVKHPNIVNCLDIHFSANNCYIITQFCSGGNLDETLKKSGPLNEAAAAKIILSVFQALAYLSSLGIVHRDIKISNIFLTETDFKVGDFGFAIKATSNFRDVTIGSPLYMSPQGLIHNLYGPKTDVWAFGILIYELLHGSTPLEACKSQEELRRKVLEPPEIKVPISQELRELMSGCLCPNESERLSVRDIAESKFIQRARLEAEQEKIYEKQLSLTNKSTCNSLSSTTSSFPFEQLTELQALALLNYCKFTLRVAQIVKSSIFSKCLIWLTKILAKTRIKTNQQEKSTLTTQEMIKQLKDTVSKEFGNKITQEFCLRDMVTFCLRGAPRDRKVGIFLEYLGKESELLVRSMESGCLDPFVQNTKSQYYFQQLLFR